MRSIRLLVAVVLLASCTGCGGGGGGVTPQITRVIVGTLQWPASLGAITEQQGTLRQVRSGIGVVEPPLATSAVTGTTFRIENVPADGLMELAVSGRTGSGLIARLRAIIGTAVGRGRDPQEISVTLTVGTTVASEAVVTLLENGAPESGITPAVLWNLEQGAAPLSGSVDLTSDESVSQAADVLLQQTANGTLLPVHGQGAASGG